MDNIGTKFLPEEMVQLLESTDEDDLNIFFRKAGFHEDSPTVEIELSSIPNYSDNIVKQQWRIEILAQKAGKIHLEITDTIQLLDDHPLLWEFNDVCTSLYFHGDGEKLIQLFPELYRIHYDTFQNYLPFRKFLNDTLELQTLLRSGNGLLASGPKKYIEKFSECFISEGIEHSLVGEREPKFWNGNSYVSQRVPVKVLIIGNSYLIAENFSFEKILRE